MLRVLRIAIEVLLVGIVVFTCLAFGGTPSWTWLVAEIAVAVAVILWVLRMMVERKLCYVKTPLNLLLILLLLYIFFQVVPLPGAVLRVFQANTVRMHTVGPSQAVSAPAALDVSGSYPISLNRVRTRGHLYLYMAYVGFFLVLTNNVTGRQQLGRMVGVVLGVTTVVAIAGFATANQEERLLYGRWGMSDRNDPDFLSVGANPEFSAGYGIVSAHRETGREEDTAKERREAVDWYLPMPHLGDVFGAFPSSNSAAAMMVMTLVLSIGVFFAYVSTRRAEWGRSGGLLYTREGNITLLALFTAVLLICGLGLARSRAGILLMVLMVPVLIVLNGFSRSLLAGVITVVVVAVLVIAPLAVLGPSQVRTSSGRRRVWLNPWEQEIRLLGREAAWKISGDFPLFGTGLATFADVYPSYKTFGPMLYFAHCDPLQWMAEMGLVGTVLAAAILLYGAVTVVLGWFRLKDPFFRRLLLGSVLACVMFLAWTLVDFPLRIPGVTILFVTLAAVSIIVARDQIARHEESDFIF